MLFRSPEKNDQIKSILKGARQYFFLQHLITQEVWNIFPKVPLRKGSGVRTDGFLKSQAWDLLPTGSQGLGGGRLAEQPRGQGPQGPAAFCTDFSPPVFSPALPFHTQRCPGPVVSLFSILRCDFAGFLQEFSRAKKAAK